MTIHKLSVQQNLEYKMAKIIDNPNGRRMIRLSVDDVLMIVSMYQQNCSNKTFTYDDARAILSKRQFYLPEDL